jgi:chromosome segregation ATPase
MWRPAEHDRGVGLPFGRNTEVRQVPAQGDIMNVRHWFAVLLVAAVANLAWSAPAEAWSRYSRGYRAGRNYNRYSSRIARVQRAANALNSARAQLAAAQTNAARQIRQSRQRAQNSPTLTSARSADANTARDYQSARSAVIAKLNESNAEFRDLMTQFQARRTAIIQLTKSGDPTGKIPTLQDELKSMSRKITQLEEQALKADPRTRELNDLNGTTHASFKSAEKDAVQAVANDPAVQSAQKQVDQARLKTQQASQQYGNALASANSVSSGYRPRYRRSGYGGFRGFVSFRQPSYYRVPRMHHVHTKAVSFHPVRRRR